MSETTIDQIEDESLTYEVSDELLETAAVTENSGTYTIGFCTGIFVCPLRRIES